MSMQSFYERLGNNEKRWLEGIYRLKEFPISLDYLAFSFLPQRIAFEKVIKKESFEFVNEISKFHEGNIAFLTLDGEYAIMGKLNDDCRMVYNVPVHNPPLNENGKELILQNNFGLNSRPTIQTKSGEIVEFSKAICLARSLNDFEYDNQTFKKVLLDITNTYYHIRHNMRNGKNLDSLVINKD